MARGRQRSKVARGSASEMSSRGSRATRGKRRGGTASNPRASQFSTTRTRCVKRPWVDSDEERDKPDFYSDSSDIDCDDVSPVRDRKRRAIDLDFVVDEEELEEEEDDCDMEAETPSVGSRGQAAGTSVISSDEDISMCPWVEIPEDRLPVLELPEGSKDLLLEESLLFQALEVYETCRSYYRSVHISPFLFEDFCAALKSREQSKLLAEIHIAFLKLALKDDEEEQITLCAQDTNNSFNITIQLIEPMTYAEVLRQYVESDPHRFPSEVLESLSGNYPFVDVKNRLIVLSWLCDRFLHSTDFRNIVKNEGKFISDEHCRECGKPGDVLLCDGCEACYHLKCANLDTIPDGQWLCQVCIIHQVRGVTDCESPSATAHRSLRQPLRMTPLGYDRHGRRYWFAVRRIFVQDDVNGTLTYYSTLPQLFLLLSRFVVVDLEKNLSAAILDILPVIAEQMKITLELTKNRATTAKAKLKTFLDVDNVRRMGDIISSLRVYDSIEDQELLTVYLEGGRSVEVSKSLLLSRAQELLGFRKGRLADFIWTAGLTEDEVLQKRNASDSSSFSPSTASQTSESDEKVAHFGLRLGDNHEYRNYCNQYSVNDYAKTPYLRAKERDKTKYLCNRFSLVDEGEFEWAVPKGRDVYGIAPLVGVIIQLTLNRFSQKIPSTLMHRLWKRDGLEEFKKGVTMPTTVEKLRDLLLRFECGLRKTVMASVFWNTLGYTRLTRVTAEDRELKQEADIRKKKMERELATADAEDDESDVVWVKYTKVGGPPKHSLWRQKDEQYRINGRGALGGWMWVSNTLIRDIRPLPQRPAIGEDAPTETENSEASRKARHLEAIVKKLSGWRIEQEERRVRELQRGELLKCYSPMCRMGIRPVSVVDESSTDLVYQQCYSVTCREAFAGIQLGTTGVVRAWDPSKPDPACVRKNLDDSGENVLGEGKPFPLPVPFNFCARRTGKQSLLVLPQRALRRLARQGGRSNSFFAPGFHRIAKSNMHLWNYPCQRPLFDHCWRYVTLRARSFHAIALQLRILYACVRWGDMERGEDEEPRVTIHHPDHDEVRTVVGHKEFPPDGLYERYKLKLQLIPLDDPNDIADETGVGEDAYRPGRAIDSSRSSRRRKSVVKARSSGVGARRTIAQISEKWIDGVELKLWEIAAYWKAYENLQRRSSLGHPANTLRTSVTNGTPMLSAVSSRREPTIMKRRPVPKRNPDFEYDIGDNEEVDEVDYQRNAVNVRRTVSSESPFDPHSRIRNRYISIDENYRESRKMPGQLRGGGKFAVMQHPGGGVRRVMLCPNDPPQIPRPADSSPRPQSNSPIDEPPLIPRYDNSGSEGSSSQHRTLPRPGASQTHRIIYASPSMQGASVRPLASKVLMIRRADGSTQFLRPISQSNSKDSKGGTRTIITTAQVGGSTMSEVRGSAVTPQRIGFSESGSALQHQKQVANGSLDDHSGMAYKQQPHRILPAFRGRPVGNQPIATRLVRVAASNLPVSQPSTSGVYVHSPQSSTGSGTRIVSSGAGSSVIIADKDPLIKRVTAEKTINGSPADYSDSNPNTIRRRATGGDVYAGYYGEKSNDLISVEEYQMLAVQGYRPPGRPPGRLASSFGYGPRANQQETVVVSQRGGRSSVNARYHSGEGTVVGSDLRPVTKYGYAVQRQQGGLQSVGPKGATYSMVGHSLGGQVRNVTSYKEYCMKRGIEWRGDRYRRPVSRPVRFEFESNEEEEKAIAEAIEKEEALMRLEEEQEKAAAGLGLENDPELQRFDEEIRRKELAMRREAEAARLAGSTYTPSRRPDERRSNLLIQKDDPPDLIVFKELMNELVMQVCRWDKTYGWHKAIVRKARERRDAERGYRQGRSKTRQAEIDLAEHIDRYRKEVNKKRLKLEVRAEAEAGMNAPWRRPRGRPNKASKKLSSLALFGAPVDPSEISLGGSSCDFSAIKEEKKEESENIAPLEPSMISLHDCEPEVKRQHLETSTTGGSGENGEHAPEWKTPKEDVSELDISRERRKKKTKVEGTALERNSHSAPQPQEANVIPQRARGRPRKKKPTTPSAVIKETKDDSGSASTPIDPSQKHCTCNKPYDPKKFYVGCSACYRWFHGKCVGVTEKKFKEMSHWICESCSKDKTSMKQELFCTCQTPYDDSRFYVGCDGGCEGWFHPQCVGITQAEAEKLATYICPECKKKEKDKEDEKTVSQSGYESAASGSSTVIETLNRADYHLLWRILEEIIAEESSQPFQEEVDKKKHPDYYRIIKRPMDLGTVQSKVERLEYHRLKDFTSDILLIFENARAYNAKSSAIYQAAEALEKIFKEKFVAIKEQIESRNRERISRLSESRTGDLLDIDADDLLNSLGEEDIDMSLFDDLL